MIGELGVVGEAERRVMLVSPHIQLTVATGVSHVIPGNAPALFIEVVRALLSDDA